MSDLATLNIIRVYRTPLKVFSGHVPRPLLLREGHVDRYKKLYTLTDVGAQRLVKIEVPQNTSEEVNIEFTERVKASRANRGEFHNHKINVKLQCKC